jgi:predicted metal-dependent hydrolase
MNSISFLCNEREILIKRNVSLRAKRLSLRLPSREDAFILTYPPRTTDSAINAFLKQCGPWIEKNLKKISPTKHFSPGDEVILHGIPFQCVLDPLRRKPSLCKVTRTLRLPPKYTQEVLHDFLKKMATEHLTPYLMKVVKALGQRIEKLTFRDTRSRWGSCSAHKTISLNWRLILAPPEVAQYVCIHEAAHLLHMNHSVEFWKLVSELCPRYKSHKKWLKINGMSLMRV